METAVGVDAALLVQLAGPVPVVGEKFADLALHSPRVDVQPVDKVGPQAAAAQMIRVPAAARRTIHCHSCSRAGNRPQESQSI